MQESSLGMWHTSPGNRYLVFTHLYLDKRTPYLQENSGSVSGDWILRGGINSGMPTEVANCSTDNHTDRSGICKDLWGESTLWLA